MYNVLIIHEHDIVGFDLTKLMRATMHIARVVHFTPHCLLRDHLHACAMCIVYSL